MLAQATLDGFFDLLSMPNVFGFWRTLFVNRPVRPDLLVAVVHIEDYPHPDGQYGVVYPIKRGDETERADDRRYAVVWRSGNRLKFDEATYFKADGLAEVRVEHDLPKLTFSEARRFDTGRPLEQGDKTWLVETIDRQRVKRTRKRELKL